MFYTSLITTNTTSTPVMTPDVALAYVMNYSYVMVIFLITLLAIKLIVRSNAYKNSKIANFNKCLNMVITPLLFVWLFVVAYSLLSYFSNI